MSIEDKTGVLWGGSMRNKVKILKALSDKTRLRMFVILARYEMCVCELESVLGMKQSHISHCLRILREAGLIRASRTGKWIIYSYNGSKAARFGFIRSLLDECSIPESDAAGIRRCRKDRIRQKCVR